LLRDISNIKQRQPAALGYIFATLEFSKLYSTKIKQRRKRERNNKGQKYNLSVRQIVCVSIVVQIAQRWRLNCNVIGAMTFKPWASPPAPRIAGGGRRPAPERAAEYQVPPRAVNNPDTG
jgi:hypothetical protein